MPLTPERMKELDAAVAAASPNGPTPGAAGGSRIRSLADYSTARNNSMDQESSLFNIGDELVDNLKKRGQKIGEIVNRQSGPDQLGFLETGWQTAGELAGGITDIGGAVLKGAYSKIVPDKWQQGARRIGREILNTDIGQAGMEALHKGVEAWSEFEKKYPDVAADISSAVNIASFIPIGGGVKLAKGASTAAVDAVKAAPGAAKNLALNTVEKAGSLYKGTKKGLFGEAARTAEKETAETAARSIASTAERSLVDDAAAAAAREIPAPSGIPTPAAPINAPSLASDAVESQVPNLEQIGEKAGRFMREKSPRSIRSRIERVKPNVEATQAEDAAYSALAPESQKAVRSGLLRRDVEAFTGGNDKEKSILRDMVKAAEENTNNRGTQHPSDLVGKEMNRRIKLLDDERKAVGKELGEQVRGLKEKDLLSSAEAKIKGKMGNEVGRTYRNGTEVVQDQVINRLNEVPGLEGIKMTEGEGGKMVLDFSDTALSGSQSKGAREELQALFDDVNNRNPYQLHRLRQEIFESLGGKKAAQLQLTETQEQGMDAIREGIADALELTSDGYKAINAQYRSLVTPLKEMRKFYKGTEGAAEDVLDAKAGLLARRLTSNVASAPELRRILDEIGSQLAKRGKDVSDVDLNKLQDMYNALNRYYDITKDTTFEGLIKSANANPTDFSVGGLAKKLLVDPLAKNTYITKDTQRAAIRELLGITE